MNALGDSRVAEYLNENFVCTYLKVGTFQIVNGQKRGGNVASYYCACDGAVLHAVPGKLGADQLLAESRWASETRKSALTYATDLTKGVTDPHKYRDRVARAHTERYRAEQQIAQGKKGYPPLPANFPRNISEQSQVHWLLARHPMVKLDTLYPVVWTQVLNEQLSGLPVAKQ